MDRTGAATPQRSLAPTMVLAVTLSLSCSWLVRMLMDLMLLEHSASVTPSSKLSLNLRMASRARSEGSARPGSRMHLEGGIGF